MVSTTTKPRSRYSRQDRPLSILSTTTTTTTTTLLARRHFLLGAATRKVLLWLLLWVANMKMTRSWRPVADVRSRLRRSRPYHSPLFLPCRDRLPPNHGRALLVPHSSSSMTCHRPFSSSTVRAGFPRIGPGPSFRKLATQSQRPRQTSESRLSSSLSSTAVPSSDDRDTIFAWSSGTSANTATALAVMRISGPGARETLQSMLQGRRFPAPRQAALCKLYHPMADSTNHNHNNNMLDQALVLWFPAPHSFTGDDVVELHCHGSRAVVVDVLDALATRPGHRLAEPGEFTQRAFAAGKLDLLQVEALADLLGADTSRQRQQALNQLDGRLSQTYDHWRALLIKGLAHAEAVIDFGDDEALGGGDDDEGRQEDGLKKEDTQQWNIWGNVQHQMQDLCQQMQHQLQDSRRGELVREGLHIGILGPPNAGKSSLFNVLAQKEAAIVSNIAGTTRDVLELSLNLGGIKCVLSDTAGVRTTSEDVIEQEGIKRAKAVAQKADVVVAMVEISDAEYGLDILQDVLSQSARSIDTPASEDALDPQNVLLVLNKVDLKDDNAASIMTAPWLSETNTFEISCRTSEGIDTFLDALTRTVTSRVNGQDNNGNAGTSTGSSTGEGSLITRARHRQHIQAAVEALERFDTLSRQGTMVVDMAAEELRLAASELGRVTGAVDVEDILDVLFTDFCIGK